VARPPPVVDHMSTNPESALVWAAMIDRIDDQLIDQP
jgi:hypothetical protein